MSVADFSRHGQQSSVLIPTENEDDIQFLGGEASAADFSLPANQRPLPATHERSARQQTTAEQEVAIHLGVVDTMLADLYDVARDIGQSNMYDLKRNTLAGWHANLLRGLDMLGRALRGAIGDSPERKRRAEMVLRDEIGTQTGEVEIVFGRRRAEQRGNDGEDGGSGAHEGDELGAESEQQQQQVVPRKPGTADKGAQFPEFAVHVPVNAVVFTGDEAAAHSQRGHSPIPALSRKVLSNMSELSHLTSASDGTGPRTAVVAPPKAAVSARSGKPAAATAEEAAKKKKSARGASKSTADAAAAANAATTAVSPRVATPQQAGMLPCFVSGAVHFLLDALLATVDCSWCSFFLLSRSKELVLVASVGSRRDQRPGALRLSSSSGIESLVLSTGIGLNITNAYAEAEFNTKQDEPAGGSSGAGGGGGGSPLGVAVGGSAHERTRSQLVFPVMRPAPDGSGYGSHALGVIHASNKHRTDAVDLATGGAVPFTSSAFAVFSVEDEHRCAEAAHLLGCILARHPCDLTSPALALAFDPSAMLSKHAREPGTATGRGIHIEASSRFAAGEPSGSSPQPVAASTIKLPPVVVPTSPPSKRGSAAAAVAAASPATPAGGAASPAAASSFRRSVASPQQPQQLPPARASFAQSQLGSPLQQDQQQLRATPADSGAPVVLDASGAAGGAAAAAIVGSLVSFNAHHKKGAGNNAALTVAPPSRRTQLVYRTSKAGHVKRSELVQGAVALPPVTTIADAIDQVTKINSGWRNAVVLNIELEHELAKLKDQLRSSQRECSRLQALVVERVHSGLAVNVSQHTSSF